MTWFHEPAIETLKAVAPEPESEPDDYGEWLADRYEPGDSVESLPASQREELNAALVPGLSAMDLLKATRPFGRATYTRAKLIAAKFLVESEGPEWTKRAAAQRCLGLAEAQLREPCDGLSDMVSSAGHELFLSPPGGGETARGRAVAWFVSGAAWDTADIEDVDEGDDLLDDGFLDEKVVFAGIDECALRLTLLLEL
jgi:hypothetical protein